MLGLPSENESVALTSDAIMAGVLEKCGLARVRLAGVVLRASARRPNGLDDLANLGPVEVRGRLLAAEKDVEQVVVGELHQQAQAFGVGFAHRLSARSSIARPGSAQGSAWRAGGTPATSAARSSIRWRASPSAP